MKQDIEEDIVIRKYLMGDLQQAEQLLVEERLFLDNEYFQMRQAVEDDLIDEYVYGELSPDERRRFEQYFLSTPERHEALKIAEALKHYISINSLPEAAPSAAVTQPPPPPPKVTFPAFLRGGHPLWRLPLAASLILITICALWLGVRVLRPPDRPAPIQAQQPLPKEKEEAGNPTPDSQPGHKPELNTDSPTPQDQYAEKRERPLTGEREPAKTMEGNERARRPAPSVKQMPARVYSFVLAPGGITRGGGDITRVELRAGAGSANLQLLLLSGGDFPAYQATLLTDDGRPIRNWKGLKSTPGESGKFVSVKVPANLLRQQTYYVKLSGDSSGGDTVEISTYYFHVLK
jgi:hypothetical protein